MSSSSSLIFSTFLTSPISWKSTLLAYPELLLAAAVFLLFFLLLHRRNSSSLIPSPFPLLGHLPYLFIHFHCIHDFVTDTLRHSACSFFFAGPTGSQFDLLLTSRIFNSGDESWKFQCKKAHSFMSAPKFRAFVVESASSKVQNHLLPLFDCFSETSSSSSSSSRVLDLEDVFMRLETWASGCPHPKSFPSYIGNLGEVPIVTLTPSGFPNGKHRGADLPPVSSPSDPRVSPLLVEQTRDPC